MPVPLTKLVEVPTGINGGRIQSTVILNCQAEPIYRQKADVQAAMLHSTFTPGITDT